MDKRIKEYKNCGIQANYAGSFVMIGCGSIGRALLPMLCKLVSFKKLTIIDRLDVRDHIKVYLAKPNIKFRKLEITKSNYAEILSKYLKSGDFLVDVAYDISTKDMLKWCHENGVMFTNMSVEVFDRESIPNNKYSETTLYHRNQEIRKMVKNWDSHAVNPTAIPDIGENPGMISTFCKKGLTDIAKSIIRNSKTSKEKRDKLAYYLKHNYFKHLACELGLKVIHITEKDTQITNNPKKPGEFVNSWSPSGAYEELCYGCSEAGWGTHEKTIPNGAAYHTSGEKNQIYFKNHGCDLYVRSWQKSGPYVGMLIRHGESYSISSRLTLHKEELEKPRSYIHDPMRHFEMANPVYRPTVGFIFLPTDSCMASIHEVRANDYKLGDKLRNMYEDITQGMDEIACLLIGDFGVWSVGTSLDIHETRKLIDISKNDINATGCQASGSMISSIIYSINNPNIGVCYPDDIDFKKHYKIAKMFQGPIHSKEIIIEDKKDLEKIKEGQFGTFALNLC